MIHNKIKTTDKEICFCGMRNKDNKTIPPQIQTNLSLKIMNKPIFNEDEECYTSDV